MKARSPVLGYNHNVRYAGRLWHVQTEDSGVTNPHLFTHLFHEGTILATKRADYDPSVDVPTVQRLMQTQHKAMLRELKAGAFDDKIGKFFGRPVERDPDEQTDPNQSPVVELYADAADEETLATSPSPFAPPTRAAKPAASAKPASSTRVRPTPPPAPSRSNLPAQSGSRGVARPSTAGGAPRVGGIGGRRAPTPAGGVPSSPNDAVVVARPAVIIGGDQAKRETAASRGAPIQTKRWHSPSSTSVPASPEKNKAPASDSIFGGDLISEKSLDEVILAYLSEDMNEK